jgi:hypothetical protein
MSAGIIKAQKLACRTFAAVRKNSRLHLRGSHAAGYPRRTRMSTMAAKATT